MKSINKKTLHLVFMNELNIKKTSFAINTAILIRALIFSRFLRNIAVPMFKWKMYNRILPM